MADCGEERLRRARLLALGAGVPDGIPAPDHVMVCAGYSWAEIEEMKAAFGVAVHVHVHG